MIKLPCVCCVDEVINTVTRAYFFLCIDVAFASENWISDNKQHGCVSLASERYLWSWITKLRQANTYQLYGFPRRNYFHSTLFWDFGFKWKQNNTKIFTVHLQVVVDFVDWHNRKRLKLYCPGKKVLTISSLDLHEGNFFFFSCFSFKVIIWSNVCRCWDTYLTKYTKFTW